MNEAITREGGIAEAKTGGRDVGDSEGGGGEGGGGRGARKFGASARAIYVSARAGCPAADRRPVLTTGLPPHPSPAPDFPRPKLAVEASVYRRCAEMSRCTRFVGCLNLTSQAVGSRRPICRRLDCNSRPGASFVTLHRRSMATAG